MNTPKLILASGSPRRRELLRELGIEYTVQPSSVDEEEVVARSQVDKPEDIVTLLASAKAWDIAGRTTDYTVILGADTIVGLTGKAGEPIAVRVPGRAEARIGERAALQWDKAREHRFDRASGRRVGAPPS